MFFAIVRYVKYDCVDVVWMMNGGRTTDIVIYIVC